MLALDGLLSKRQLDFVHVRRLVKPTQEFRVRTRLVRSRLEFAERDVVSALRQSGPSLSTVLLRRRALVELHHPGGKRRHVVGAADESASLGVIPIRSRWRMAPGQNCRAVLQRDRHDFRPEVRCCPQLVPERAADEVVRREPRFLVGPVRAAHEFCGRVLDAIDGAAERVIVPLVADDSVHVRVRPSEETGMAGARGGGGVIIAAIREASPAGK